MKILFVSLGCDKNLVDSEVMIGLLGKKGFSFTDDETDADVIVINTCCFINDAKEESINTILEMAEYRKSGCCKALIVTGCLAQRYKQEIVDEIPEVDAVLGTTTYDAIVETVEKVLEGQKELHFEDIDRLVPEQEGARTLTTGGHYAYLKIAEGCDKHCTYCIIPKVRGNYRSVPMEQLFAEATELAVNGVRELILIAQDSTRYGEDIYGKPSLPELLEKLCTIPQLKWIRVLYCYPERISDELLDVMAREDKIVKYIDMPIQHCDADILKKMNRPGDEETLRALIKKIREKVPGIILRTTLITGFPTETVEQFDRLADFVRDMEFDRLGCFPYSAEEGTKAAKMDGQLDEETKQHRADIIMEQQMMIMGAKNQLLRDTVIETLVEGYDRYGECYFGRSAADAPEIDGKIFFNSKKRKLVPGMFVHVHINEVMDYDLIGDVVDESAQ